VGVDSSAKGKLQSDFAHHVITLLTPEERIIYPIRYGLNTEVKDAGSLFRVMRDVDDFGIHTIVAVSDWNCGLCTFHSPASGAA